MASKSPRQVFQRFQNTWRKKGSADSPPIAKKMKCCCNLHQAPSKIFLTILSALLLFRATLVHARADVQFSWSVIDYTWPTREQRLQALQNEDYIEANNAIAGIKVYRNWVYLTVPRWLQGVPSTLNRISIDNRDSSPPLIPYPNWHMNELGNCDSLQYVQSMEIVPRTVEIQK